MNRKLIFVALVCSLFGIATVQAQSYSHIAPHTVGGMRAPLTGTTFQSFISVGLVAAGNVENPSRTRVALFGPWPIYRLHQQEDAGTSIEQTDKPASFWLHQNYPNPFNPQTIIRYALPRASRVRLAVYDVLGREIALLADGLQAAGAYEALFEAIDIPSGVYLYRLEAGDLIQTRVMLLAK